MRRGCPRIALGGALAILVVAILVVEAIGGGWALAYKEKPTTGQLAAFEDVFMDQVKLGDALFHGDATAEQQVGTQLSKTGMACAMCHPFASDMHPNEFPKFQEQMNKVVTLRDMINWCVEKPNEGVAIPLDSDAMKALEAYITWSNKGGKPGVGLH